MIIELHNPTVVVFGRGKLADLGERTKSLGGHALLVCGRSAMRRHGVLDAATAALEASGVAVTVYDGVSPDPLASEVDAAADLARRSGCDVVVGLGGGSAIDAAKATAIGLREGPIGPLVGTTLPAVPDAVPVVAVPTTAGSGAEVTKGAIITDDERNLKSGIRGDRLFPAIAVIDPDLLLTMPETVAVDAGFDALAHSVEGYVARRANPVTRLLAEQALEILGTRLPRAAAGDREPGLLDDIALAALLGGINVANASTCLPHRLQQAMGSVPGVRVSHGRGLAIVYPAWLRRAQPHAEVRFATIGRLLGHDDAVTAIGKMLETIGAGGTLRTNGFAHEHIDQLVGGITGNIGNDPIPDIDLALIREIYEDSH
ncbi:iron-containing alcohol dehydrogenase [Saccharopolyspora phatthalungensis]|uniref:Alcohol dehydrogenase class IV n=1 Tax=Saccharopolyspora phatthalungensis TaxID=664693 RepID=A0A840QF96_9PSEU|nr:iron-containing alcohol dehydrogenase [Saccharopolyspora phatthalungensis]MBB5159504.1 alcohol dehydrogenase class IV [Saccharopolyspora phatthalungensis]